MDLVRTHAQAGYDILSRIEFPWPIAEIVYQHHERMDGSGYPRGLKAEEISMEGRVLAVADVVEAMVSHRPYRSAHTEAEAIEEIRANRGKLYDPAAVDVCVGLFVNREYQFSR
jgi:HD-GYP domain-containing protein (c-di-GMP phosphodiesterase class II)